MYAITYTDPGINNGYNTQVITVRILSTARAIKRELVSRGMRNVVIERMHSGRFIM